MMGQQDVEQVVDEHQQRAFMKAILNDLRALEQMLKDGLVESWIRCIDAEQEMFLVDSDPGPAADAGGGSQHDINWLLECGQEQPWALPRQRPFTYSNRLFR